jgi:hypothetical protein
VFTGDGTLDEGERMAESVIDKRLAGIDVFGTRVLGEACVFVSGVFVSRVFVAGGWYNDSFDGSTSLCNESELIFNTGGRTGTVDAGRRWMCTSASD